MKRIAIIAGKLHSGGKKNLIMEYYRHINRDQVQFDFICDSNSNGIPDEEIKKLGGRVYRIAPYKNIYTHMSELYSILHSNKYDVMHAFDNTLNLFPMLIGKFAGVRLRISESISKGDKLERKTMAKYILRMFSHWFTNFYMANSEDCGKWQFGEKAFKNGEIAIFKTVIDTEANAYNEELRTATRKKYNIDDKVVYGFIGRYESQKNPIFLLDIFSEIAKRQSNAILVMIGFGALEDSMNKHIDKLKIKDKVLNIGRTEDIKPFYNAFDAFLLPSLYEGMPVVGIEAQCAGLPIFFSKNITKETTASSLAHYISLDDSASTWAQIIIDVVVKNLSVRKDCSDEVKSNGFDSKSEALRIQQLYLTK